MPIAIAVRAVGTVSVPAAVDIARARSDSDMADDSLDDVSERKTAWHRVKRRMCAISLAIFS